MTLAQDVQPHHSFLATMASHLLATLRPLFKLTDEESAAWDLVVGFLQSL